MHAAALAAGGHRQARAGEAGACAAGAAGLRVGRYARGATRGRSSRPGRLRPSTPLDVPAARVFGRTGRGPSTRAHSTPTRRKCSSTARRYAVRRTLGGGVVGCSASLASESAYPISERGVQLASAVAQLRPRELARACSVPGLCGRRFPPRAAAGWARWCRPRAGGSGRRPCRAGGCGFGPGRAAGSPAGRRGLVDAGGRVGRACHVARTRGACAAALCRASSAEAFETFLS